MIRSSVRTLRGWRTVVHTVKSLRIHGQPLIPSAMDLKWLEPWLAWKISGSPWTRTKTGSSSGGQGTMKSGKVFATSLSPSGPSGTLLCVTRFRTFVVALIFISSFCSGAISLTTRSRFWFTWWLAILTGTNASGCWQRSRKLRWWCSKPWSLVAVGQSPQI